MNAYALLSIALVGWGFWGIFNKAAQNRLYPIQVSIMSALSSFITLPILLYAFKQSGQSFRWDLLGIFWGVLAAFTGTIATLAYTFSLQKVSVIVANAWNAACPAVTFILCLIIFKEKADIWQWLGMIFIMVGVALVSL